LSNLGKELWTAAGREGEKGREGLQSFETPGFEWLPLTAVESERRKKFLARLSKEKKRKRKREGGRF